MEITSHPPRLDALTLVQDHGWRLAVHLGVLSFALQKSATAASGEEILPCTGLLFGFYLVLTSLSLYWIYSEFALIRRRSSLPPGPLGWPMVGTFLSVFSNPVETSLALRKRFGSSLFTNNFFGRLVVTLGDDESLEWIWHQERKGETVQQWPPTIQQLLGAGSVGNLNGHRHRVLRRILDGALAPGAVRDYLKTIDLVTQQQLQEWATTGAVDSDSSSVDRDVFHPSSVFKLFSLRLFLVSAYGEMPNEDLVQQLHNDFIQWLQGFGALGTLRFPGSTFARSMQARERILKTVDKLVQMFKTKHSAESERGKRTLMGRLVYGRDEQGQAMSQPDILDNILNLIFAGHDT